MEINKHLVKGSVPEKSSTNPLIQEIIDKLYDNKMSVLVGAGFSKNASSKFPGWLELLEDMIVEQVYKEEFEEWKSKDNKEENKSDFAWKTAQKEGYLEIVEKYINLNGMREAITFYIEDRFNEVYKNGGNIDLNLHKNLLSLPWNNVYTTNYDHLLETASNETGLDYKLVINSENLALSSNKRIIKLHGSLRSDEEIEKNEFGFDKDLNKHYVIAKSDYETYPEKHSAFTHLMRIALLQESFCLIGFSGEDPNFIKWVEWVRDILKNNKNDKVYLLDTSSREISREKKLYFKNYGIKHVPLKDIYNNKKTDNERAEKFIEELLAPSTGEKEKIEETTSNYEKLLEEVNPANDLKELINLEKNFIFPKYTTRRIAEQKLLEFRDKLLNFFQSNDKNEILKGSEFLALYLRNSYMLLGTVYKKENLQIIKASLIKIKNELISISEKRKWFYLAEHFLKYYRSNLDAANFFDWINEIEGLKFNNRYIYNRLTYEKAIWYAINFDFENLENIVKNWDINEDYSERWFFVKKAFLILILNNKSTKEARNLVKKAENLMKIPQDITFINEILAYYDDGIGFSRNSQSEKKIKEYESLGCYKLNDMIEALKVKNEKNEKRKRHQTKGVIFGSKKEEREYFNTQYLCEALLDIGLPIKIGRTVWFVEEEWKKLYKNIVKINLNTGVLLSLFYGENSSEEEHISSIFKATAVNRDISKEDKVIILNGLINIWGYFYKKNIINNKVFFAIGELVQVIEYSIWENFFNKIWEEVKINDSFRKLIYTKMWGLSVPFSKFLQFIEDKKIIEEILINNIDLSMGSFDSFSENVPFENIFNLIHKNNNKMLKQLNKEKLIKSLKDQCVKDKIGDSEIIKIYYLRTILDADFIKSICKKIDFSEINNKYLVLEITTYDDEIVNKFKEFIFSNIKFIFNTGIVNKSRSGRGNRLNISKLVKDEKINLNENEIVKIYDRLKIAFDEIQKYNNSMKNNSIFKNEDISLLRDMKNFLRIEGVLKEKINESEFNDIFNKVESLYKELIGFSHTIEGISSSDPDIILNAIEELHDNLINAPKIERNIEWQVFLSLILLKNKLRLEESFDILVSILYNLKSLNITKNHWLLEYRNYYLEILKNYKEWYDSEIDMFFIEKSLIKVAFMLKKYFNINDDIIEFWLDRKNKNMFEDIKKVNFE